MLPEVNSALGRRTFLEKKGRLGQQAACYANSDLKITRELAGLDDWTPQELCARQKRLADWALKRWHVDAPPPLPNEPWERKLEQAKRDGVGKEFLELREFAQALKLGVTVTSKSVAYKPRHNWNLSAITVRTYPNWLQVTVRPHNIPVPQAFPKERVKEILGGERGWWVSPETFDDLRNRLETLVSELGAK